jgi:hypothetical protein
VLLPGKKQCPAQRTFRKTEKITGGQKQHSLPEQKKEKKDEDP